MDFQCQYCSITISKKYNLKRHEQYCPKNPKPLCEKFKCENCKKSFQRRDGLNKHLKKCCNSEGFTPKKSFLPCNYNECQEKFLTLSLLVSHLKSCHNAPVSECQTISFENENDFINWKEKEQSQTFSYFAKKCGDHLSDEGRIKYFYCQNHGSEKAHRKIDEPGRKTSRKMLCGRTKTGDVCFSSLKATYLPDGSVVVVYQPTHSHPLNPSLLQFQPLSSDSYEYIDTQIAAGVSPLVIKRELKNRALEKGDVHEESYNNKDCYVSLNLIKERARRKQHSSMYHPEDAKSVMLLTQHLVKEDPDLVIIYKPLGMECYIGPQEINSLPDSTNIFMYGFQTKEQRELMHQGCKMILILDETHGTNQYGFSLLNMLVVDDNKHGWPVGHLITNKGDEQCLTYFFQAVKSKITELDINCVITDDDPKLINALENGFGEKLRHILCMWHLSKNFKKQLREKAPRNLNEEMFVGLKLIVDARNHSDFQTYSTAFISKYKDIATDFVTYLEQHYFTDHRVVKWARCFRNFPHGNVDTTGHIESFHNRLKSIYMNRKPNRRLDTLIQMLLTIAEDDSWTRKRQNLFGAHQVRSSIAQRHRKGLELPDESVKAVFEHMWEVISATQTGKVYEVTRCKNQCNEDLCFCTCNQCPGLCSHMYYCSCSDNQPLCKHIHKVHSFLTRDVVIPNMISEQPFFSEPALEQTDCENEFVNRTQYRETRKERLRANVQKILSILENENVSNHILSKLDTDIDNAVKCSQALLGDVGGIPKMPALVAYNSNEKLKTQASQMLPFKRPKKRKKNFDTVAAAAKKKAVSADLLSVTDNSEIYINEYRGPSPTNVTTT